METVHGPKLGSLVGELLQPLDLGKEQLFLLVDVHPPDMFYIPLIITSLLWLPKIGGST